MAGISKLILCVLPLLALAQAASLHHDDGVVITAPPRPTNTGSVIIPDKAHPFMAPGPHDQRGPCPGLNTLANHGYLPRSGIVSFQDIINGITSGYNWEYVFASGFAAFAVLARGNPLINKVSIGLDSPNVPPLPGHPDGPIARGLASHGRFEGDSSMTRLDKNLGDNIHFQQFLFDQLLDVTAQFGNDSAVTGPKSIVNLRVIQEFKFKRFQDSQSQNKGFALNTGRFLTNYGEAALTLNFFANGTDGTLSIPTFTSFLRDQRFPANWHRRSSPGNFALIVNGGNTIIAAHPVTPGANDASGKYISDPTPVDDCSFYTALARDNLPAVLLNTTGLTKKNVNFLLGQIHNLSPECPVMIPSGPANI